MNLNPNFVLLADDCIPTLQNFWIPSRLYMHTQSSKMMELVSRRKTFMIREIYRDWLCCNITWIVSICAPLVTMPIH